MGIVEDKGITVMVFGSGDIGVRTGAATRMDQAGRVGLVGFFSQDPSEIGSWAPADDALPDVRMMFTDPESIDVVIRCLERCKLHMDGSEHSIEKLLELAEELTEGVGIDPVEYATPDQMNENCGKYACAECPISIKCSLFEEMFGTINEDECE